MNPYEYKQFAVLFVDDEPQALKYFHKATDKDFQVVTASSVAEGWKMIEAEPEKFGAVVTDQRMPKEQGVELLSRLRASRPNIVRILTTAYSDLDSAIDAVNSGQIFYYVTKPWNVRELRVVLMRAMDFFLLQRERDMLLNEKLSVFQKMLVQDRARALAVFAASMTGQLDNSLQALKDYLEQAPASLVTPPTNGTPLRDLWGQLPQQSLRMLGAVEQAVQSIEKKQKGFEPVENLEALVGAEFGDVGAGLKNLPAVQADAALLENILHVIHDAMGDDAVTVRAEARQVWGTDGLSIHFVGRNGDWSSERRASVFSALKGGGDPQDGGMGVLAAFLMAYHHGGRLIVCPTAPQGPGFQLHLPLDPNQVRMPALEQDWLENLFMKIEAWE